MKANETSVETVRLTPFPSREALADALAAKTAERLADGIALRGSAVLAVSGGSTPKAFLEALSKASIDWSRVTVTLVDERLVPADHERSNHGLALRHLLRDAAAKAQFVPLYCRADTPDEAAATAAKAIDGLPQPFDVVILGMGTDGHTASFFPGGTTLEQVASLTAPASVMAIEAPGAGEPRVTLTLPVLATARFLALHIEGDEKRAVLQNAIDGGLASGLPVARVLDARPEPVAVYWAA